ncbi:MAG: flagellar basal-body rod protein FlgF [Bacillota bacterium]
MIKGLFTAASGMTAKQRQLDVVSNNLANVNNTGFKKDGNIQKSFKEVLLNRIEGSKNPVPLGEVGGGVMTEETFTNFTQGGVRQTGNQLDIAIEGSGFFVVDTPQGLRYTRDGNFTLNEDGQIVTQQGYPVMGERGPLQTIAGQSINIDGDGQLYLGDIRGDQIRVANFENNQALEKTGDNLYMTEADPQEADGDYQLRQGYLENSNVNIVEEMANMIQVTRHYEANQKVITSIDSTLNKAVNEVARLG